MIVVSWQQVTFFAIAVVMVIIAVGLLVRPWFRNRTGAAVSRDSFNVQVYKDQLAELESEMKRDRLGREEYEQARADLERGILEDAGERAPAPPPPSSNPHAGRWALVIIGVSLPVLALVLYAALHISIKALTADESAQMAGPAAAPADQGARGAQAQGQGPIDVEEMVSRKAAQLEENPNDPQGWAMLGRSYVVLEHFTQASKAFGKAYALLDARGLSPADSNLVASYAEARALANDNRIDQESTRLVNQALSLDADNPKALWLAGMSAFRGEDYGTAVEHWKRLARLLPAGSEMSPIVEGALEEAEMRAGLRPMPIPEDLGEPLAAEATADSQPEGTTPATP
jgi:cytochrome c-type biogenesis protein CcmH